MAGCTRATASPIARTLTDDGDLVLSRWDAESKALHRIAVFDGADHPMALYPLELTPDGTGVWVGSNRRHRPDPAGPDRPGHRRGDRGRQPPELRPRRALRRAVPQLPSPLIRDRRTGELLGVRYLGERQVIHALDPHFAEVLEKLEALSDGDLGELSSDDERAALGRRRSPTTATPASPGSTTTPPARAPAAVPARSRTWTPARWPR